MNKHKRALHRHVKRHWAAIHKHAKDHFIPHRGNNHHPHVLKHHVLVGYSIILILLKVIAIIGPIALPSSSLYSSAITAKNIIDLTNQTRENLNLSKLKKNDRLSRAAVAKASDMLKNQYFAHTSPSGITPWDWVKGAGYNYRYSGENLAVHFHEAEDVEAGWLASTSHRANIVNSNYTEIGVGVANGFFEGVPTTFVVQMFGAPADGQAPVVSSRSSNDNRLIVSSQSNQLSEFGTVASANINEEGLKKISEPPVINESSVAVKPLSGTYNVRLEAKNAENVTINLGEEQSPLVRAGTSDVWNGEVRFRREAIGVTGEPLILTATNNESPPLTKQLMVIAPSSSTQKLYIFDEGTERFVKFFGFLKIGNLDDKVRQFYVGFVVFIFAALLLNFFVLKFRLRHPSVLRHAVAVMGLALFLIVA